MSGCQHTSIFMKVDSEAFIMFGDNMAVANMPNDEELTDDEDNQQDYTSKVPTTILN